MKLKTLMAGAVFAAGTALNVAPAAAQIDVYVDIAPPPVRYERVPPPRRGYIWVNGHWGWSHGRHVWIPGTWIRARSGYVYERPRWQHRGNRWYYSDGYWYDRRYREDRYGQNTWRWRDRDRDGVPDHRDPYYNR